MKIKLKNYFGIFVLVVGMLLLLLNCERDTLISDATPQQVKSAYKVKKVRLSEIPKVRDFVQTKISTTLFAKSTEIDGAIFDDDTILEVIDTLQHTNYTFKFTYPNTPIGTFYNLIVGQTPAGVNITPYVVKYVSDDASLNDFVASNFNFEYFKGTMAIYKYTDYFGIESLAKHEVICPSTTDANGEPIPCDFIPIDVGGGNNNSSGGGGNPSGGGNPTSGDTNNSPTGGGPTGGPTGSGPGGPSSGGPSSGGPSSGGPSGNPTDAGSGICVTIIHSPRDLGYGSDNRDIAVWEPCDLDTNNSAYNYDNASNLSKSTLADCPDCPNAGGGVGVLSETSTTQQLINILGATIAENLVDLSIQTKLELLQFLIENNNSQEAIDFAILASEVLKDNKELSFEYLKPFFDDIIVEDDIKIEHPCQAKIIKNTFVRSAPLSKLILDIFDSDNSGYNLEFFIDLRLGSGDAGGTLPVSFTSEMNEGIQNIRIGLSEALINNSTDLAIATTVIHESIHAVLIYMIESGKLTVENTNDDFDLSRLVRAYLNYKIELEQFPGDDNVDTSLIDNFMHDYMTGLVEDIATSVSSFGKSQDYSIPFSYYKKLSWLGLKDSLESLLAEDGFTEEEQALVDSINKVIVDEFLNRQPDAKGTKCTN